MKIKKLAFWDNELEWRQESKFNEFVLNGNCKFKRSHLKANKNLKLPEIMQITIDLPDNLPLTEADVRIELAIALDRLIF